MFATALRLIEMGITTESWATRPYQAQSRRRALLDASFEVPPDARVNFTRLYPTDQTRPSWNTMWDRPPRNPEPTEENMDASSTAGEMAHLFHSPTATLMRRPPPTSHMLANGLWAPQRSKPISKTPEIAITPGEMAHLFHSPTADLMRGPRKPINRVSTACGFPNASHLSLEAALFNSLRGGGAGEFARR